MTTKPDRNEPSDDIRVLTPRELESLKGGAQPGPEAAPTPELPPPTLKPTR